MAQPLLTFEGSVIYLDAVIAAGFMDASSEWHASSRQFVYRAIDPDQPIRLVTATLTLDEATFILLEKFVQQPPYGVTHSRSQYLRSHPEVVRQLMARIDSWTADLSGIVTMEPVKPEDIDVMRQEMLATGLLPRDAIHVAVMRRLGSWRSRATTTTSSAAGGSRSTSREETRRSRELVATPARSHPLDERGGGRDRHQP
jgi:predicted nucleic acid-binding protein